MPDLSPEDFIQEMRRATRATERLSDEIVKLREDLQPLRGLGDKLGQLGGIAGILQMFGRRGGE